MAKQRSFRIKMYSFATKVNIWLMMNAKATKLAHGVYGWHCVQFYYVVRRCEPILTSSNHILTGNVNPDPAPLDPGRSGVETVPVSFCLFACGQGLLSGAVGELKRGRPSGHG